MKLDRVLTVAVAVAALAALGTALYAQLETSSFSYNSQLHYSVKRVLSSYDYSCNTPVYGEYVLLANTGSKALSGISVSVSNPLCEGAVPPLSSELGPQQQMNFTVFSNSANGTIELVANNTSLEIKF